LKRKEDLVGLLKETIMSKDFLSYFISDKGLHVQSLGPTWTRYLLYSVAETNDRTVLFEFIEAQASEDVMMRKAQIYGVKATLELMSLWADMLEEMSECYTEKDETVKEKACRMRAAIESMAANEDAKRGLRRFRK